MPTSSARGVEGNYMVPSQEAFAAVAAADLAASAGMEAGSWRNFVEVEEATRLGNLAAAAAAGSFHHYMAFEEAVVGSLAVERMDCVGGRADAWEVHLAASRNGFASETASHTACLVAVTGFVMSCGICCHR